MNADEIRTTVLDALGNVAPEADPEQLRPDVPFRDQLDIDSMDFLNFIVAIHHALGVEIPESDYGKLTTLNECLEYLGNRLRREQGAT